MIEQLASLMRPLLNNPIVKRVRRNHGYEHATVHMLNRKRYILSGRASAGGFALFGEVPTEVVEQAAEEALERLRNGQKHLAIHPNCGTNLVTTGLITTLIGAIGFTGSRRKQAWERFPVVMIFMMFAALYSQPVGMLVQEHITTEGEVGDLELVGVTKSEMNLPFRDKPITVHNIITRKG